MINGKMVDLLQGDYGAFCHYCDFTVDGIDNLIIMLAGFEKLRVMKSLSKFGRRLVAGVKKWGVPQTFTAIYQIVIAH